jgi:hypothetical protein
MRRATSLPFFFTALDTIHKELTVVKNAKPEPNLPEWPEQDTVKSHDWRLHAVTAVSTDGGGFRRGDVIKVSFPLDLRDGTALHTGAPNPDGLILDLAAKFDVEAREMQARIKILTDAGEPVEDGLAFDLFQKRMAATLFAFTAVESFANEVIAHAYSRGFQYVRTPKKGEVETLDLEAVLMHVSTDEKICSVLPAYVNKKTPKGGVHWQNFRRLKKIRNRIVHLKGADRGNSTDHSLWEAMLDVSASDFGNQMHDLIGYFVPRVDGLNFRWFYKWPHQKQASRGTNTPNVK